MSARKIATADHPVIDLIKERWSPRAFSTKPVEKDKIFSLLEAARWAPSCFNEQPWHFLLFSKDSEESFQKILDVLSPGNQIWAKNAPLLILSVAKNNFDRNGKTNKHSWHDMGAAVSYLTMQATSEGLFVHQMAGFNSNKAKEHFNVPEGYEPVSVIAIGYYGNKDDLTEEILKGEISDRKRKPIGDFTFKEIWGKGL